MSRLGQKVKEARIAQGMTQQRLADKADVNHSLVSALESGRRKYVGPQEIEKLSKALKVPENKLWACIPGGKSDRRYICIA